MSRLEDLLFEAEKLGIRREVLNKVGEIKEPQDIDLNDCDIGTKKDLVKVLKNSRGEK